MSRSSRLKEAINNRKIWVRGSEIIGMVMILGAWALEWGFAGKWQRIESGVSAGSTGVDEVRAPVARRRRSGREQLDVTEDAG